MKRMIMRMRIILIMMEGSGSLQGPLPKGCPQLAQKYAVTRQFLIYLVTNDETLFFLQLDIESPLGQDVKGTVEFKIQIYLVRRYLALPKAKESGEGGGRGKGASNS